MAKRKDVDAVLSGAVERGDVPLAVAVAADDDGVIYEGAAGDATPGTLFRIASMTKLVTTVAALQQRERGNLDLDDPVELYLPEFAEVQVLEGFDGDTPRLRPPARKATIRHLLTHTSGLGYGFWNADVKRWADLTATPGTMSGSMRIFDAPLVADPGTRFEYGISTEWLGRVIEVASGLSLRDYFDAHILGPLRMNATMFVPSDEQRAELGLVPIHRRDESGAWVATELDWSREPEWSGGGHGLYSTPRDFLRLQRALLGGGALDGVRVLERSTVDTAFANQIGELEFPARIATADPDSSADYAPGPGLKWGFGLRLNTRQEPGLRAVGSGGWAGLFNTYFWIDRASGVTGALYTQTLPFVEPRVLAVVDDFERALYASLERTERRFVRGEAAVQHGPA